MKILCIKQLYAGDDAGCGPNTFTFVFALDHLYNTRLTFYWEDGESINSNDYAVKEEDKKLVGYCLNKLSDYFGDKKNSQNLDEWAESTISAGVVDLSKEEYEKLNFNKESFCMEYVENHTIDTFNLEDDEEGLLDCLKYLVYMAQGELLFYGCDNIKDVLDRLDNNIK